MWILFVWHFGLGINVLQTQEFGNQTACEAAEVFLKKESSLIHTACLPGFIPPPEEISKQKS